MPPASAGAAIVVALMPAAFSAIAFVIFSGPTSWGMMACLAGIINAHSPPVTMDEMKRCCQAITSKSIARLTTRDREPATSCATCMIVFFSNLSATTPPKRGMVSIGTAMPRFMMPRTEAEPVMSYTR